MDDNVIAYPYMRDTDILIALSREGYEKYADELSENGILVYDADLVTPHQSDTVQAYGIQAARLAEELGNRIVQNIVVVGFTTAVTGIIDREAVAKAVESSVPGSTIELNLKAFATGYEEGQKLLAPVG